ncbi:MAG: histidine--tRNA ligase [Candidatus Rokubacteria bacterium]|nr:histidine--tRNA ligase [Candidatus Rokubacteria bacterium]
MAPRLPTEPPRGMRDILPAEAELRDFAAGTILGVYRRYGFRRVETPGLEHLDLLTGGGGGENEKLIFKVLKRGEKLDLTAAVSEADLADLGLRFDLTVPLARYYAHNHATLPHPLRAVQIGPVWRAERPQRGRYRQFTQCDIDILGVASEIAEIELILATTEALGELGLAGLTVRINDRRVLAAMAAWCGFAAERRASVFITLDKWDKLPPSEIRRELEQAAHPASAIDRLMQLYAGAPGPVDLDAMRAALGLSGEDAGFTALTRIVDTVRGESGDRFTIAFDPTLVRGMGYYTGPIFEIGSSSFAAGSIAGGGRYDDMIGAFLGRPVPATGFSIGFERVIEILGKSRAQGDRADRVAVLFDDAEGGLGRALRTARELRAQGHLVALERQARSLGAQRAALEKQGYDGAAMIGVDGVPNVTWFAERKMRREPESQG